MAYLFAKSHFLAQPTNLPTYTHLPAYHLPTHPYYIRVLGGYFDAKGKPA